MYYPLTSSISNGLLALYGSDERIINNNNNNRAIGYRFFREGGGCREMMIQ
jgi:hypothetical protein